MKINTLGFLAKSNEGDSGTKSGGNAIKFTQQSNEPTGEADDEGASDESGPDNVSSDDINYFNRIHGLSSKGERPPSKLNKAIDKSEEEDNKEEDDKEESSDEEDTKEEDGDKKDDSELTEEELLKLEEKNLKNAKGAPVSAETGKVIKQFKKSIANKVKEIEDLKKTQLTEETKKELEELRAAKAELVELRKQYEDEHFEKSDAFRQAFVEPVKAVEKVLNGFFKIPAEDKSTRAALGELFGRAAAAAEADDEAAFSSILDEIAEDYVEGGTSRKSMFGTKMLEWYSRKLEERKAYDLKDENRKKLVTRKLADQRKKNATSIDNDIDSHIEEFEVSRKAVIENLKPAEREEFFKKYKEPASKVKEALSEFSITGKISPELNETIRRGITFQAIDYEREMGWTAYKSMVAKDKVQQDTIADLQKKLAKYTGEPGERKGGYVKTGGDNNKNNERRSTSRIFDALKSVDD